jgi:hypothetical protein
MQIKLAFSTDTNANLLKSYVSFAKNCYLQFTIDISNTTANTTIEEP